MVESVELACARCRVPGCRAPDSVLGTAALTDGVFVWPESAAHYVFAHGVEPPSAFYAHVAEVIACWRARDVTRALPCLGGAVMLQPSAVRGAAAELEFTPRGWLTLLRSAGSTVLRADVVGSGDAREARLLLAKEWLACSRASSHAAEPARTAARDG